ncbi:hypothetical protein NMG60_11025755 [Bertholletia excelsa]
MEASQMAVSPTTTTAALYISWRNLTSLPTSSSAFSRSVTLLGAKTSTRSRKLIIRSSGKAAAAASPPPSPDTEDSEETPVELPKGPPSLISALNVERALRGIPITDVDHYARLGLQRGCPYDQVYMAYNNKAEELTRQGLDEEELDQKLELLKESYSVLSNEEERRFYDWSLARSENADTYAWPFEVDITQTPTGSPPPQEPEDVGPTRVVGYFAVGWLILAFTLSIALNR